MADARPLKSLEFDLPVIAIDSRWTHEFEANHVSDD